MGMAKLPLTGNPYRSIDETELDQTSASVQDAFVDEAGYTQKRPGLTEWADTGTAKGIDGLYWWDEQQVLVAVSNGRTFKFTDYTGTMTELTGATMQTGTRVSFTKDGTNVYMANGGAIIYFPLAGPLTTMADGDAPTTVTHLVSLDQYILANVKNTGTFQCSRPAQGTVWDALDVFTAESKPDRIVAMHGALDGVAMMGKESVEFWVNDGATPFSRVRGATLDYGCGAPYSVGKIALSNGGSAWIWMDDERRLIRYAGGQATPLPFPFAKQVDANNAIDDAVADTIKIAGVPFYILTFPLSNVSYAYNYRDETWAEWGYWNASTAGYIRWRGHCSAYAKTWNLHLVGDYTNGKIYTASRSVYQDDGDTIRSVRRTGFISHGTSQWKRCHGYRFRFKRGQGNSSITSPVVSVRWRDTNGAWRNEHQLSLGQVGQHELIAKLRNCGRYRTRQLELIHTDPCDWVLMDAEEDMEVVGAQP